MSDPDRTGILLRRCHEGDGKALEDLLAHSLDWVRQRVSRRLGPLLRSKGETVDYVQDAMLAALRYGPRFVVSDPEHFRRLLARIVENVLRDQHDRYAAQRRGGDAKAETIMDLDAAVPASQTRPSQAAAASEMRQWMALALELLDATDRKVLLLREQEGLNFSEIGERLGIGETGARMRYTRAVPKLAERLRQLRAGKVRDALTDADA